MLTLNPVPFCLHKALKDPIPILISSPHSGQIYPLNFLGLTRLPLEDLRKSEDSYVNDLFKNAPVFGYDLLNAEMPRLFCDLNREAWELDQDMFKESLPSWCNTDSPRVKQGIGTLHKISTMGKLIYKYYLSFNKINQHIQSYWFPYHLQIQNFIRDNCHNIGGCIILDVHSMPSPRVRTASYADIILGDAFSQSCSPWLTYNSANFFKQKALKVKINNPYAGGYITRHYGKPQKNIHVIQIEINKSLYMNEETLKLTNNFNGIQTLFNDYMQWLSLHWKKIFFP